MMLVSVSWFKVKARISTFQLCQELLQPSSILPLTHQFEYIQPKLFQSLLMDQCGGKTNDLLGLIRKWNDDHADPQQLPVSCYCFQTNQNEWNIFASHMPLSKKNHMFGKYNYKMEG